MNLLEKTLETILDRYPDYGTLRPVVEKELLHHDILREMNKKGYLKALTFIGGTCLRSCYGSERLSEDLVFSGGLDFRKDDVAELGQSIQRALRIKYDLPVTVTEPKRETGNTDTWKIKIITRPERPDFPAQRVNIDICRLPSYEKQPAMLRNQYGIEMGTSGLILYAESPEEILVDKIIALALRPNRVKNRDLWDLVWLTGRNIHFSMDLLQKKIIDRSINYEAFLSLYTNRIIGLRDGQQAFLSEMRRFLIPAMFTEDFINPLWWEHLQRLLRGMMQL